MSVGPREPEARQARQYAALVGNRRGQDHVERGQAIAGDQQQAVAHFEQIAHLARAHETGRMGGSRGSTGLRDGRQRDIDGLLSGWDELIEPGHGRGHVAQEVALVEACVERLIGQPRRQLPDRR